MLSSNHRHLMIFSLLLIILQGCSGAQTAATQPAQIELPVSSPIGSTSATKPTATPMPLVMEEGIDVEGATFEQGEETIQLWAVGAFSSSNADGLGYDAEQALGEPDTLVCGDFVTAWQPADDVYEAWLELEFFPYILPESISIIQSFNPAHIRKVEVMTLDGERLIVFDVDQEDPVDITRFCPEGRNFLTPDIDSLIHSVKISLKREPAEPWTQIDAVKVNGWVTELPYEAEVAEELSVEEPVDFFEPLYFANKNMINDVVIVGDRLWSASNGGVVAWDLNDINEPDYVHASSLAAYALAFCDWEIPLIVAGNDRGVATLTPPYSDYGPYFQQLEHPNDELFGRVVALGCDNLRQQIWVGYLGHLSRFDAGTEIWTEFSWRDGVPNATIREITVIDEDVWVATADGVAVVREGETLEVFTTENSDLPCPFVHAVSRDESGTIWMASSCGLLAFDGVDWTLLQSDAIDGGPLVNVLLAIHADDEGSLWIVDTFGTMCEFDPVNKICLQTITPPYDGFSLNSSTLDQYGRFVLGSFTEGLLLFDGDNWVPLRTRDQVSSNTIQAIAYTPDGHLWVAGDNGLQYFQASQPSSPWMTESLPGNARAHSLFVASDGLWIGHTRGARFIPYFKNLEKIDLIMDRLAQGIDRTITAINRDANGLVYFGLSSGMVIWDGSDLRYDDLLGDEERSAGNAGPRVNSIFYDEDTVWVGTSRGLFQYVDGNLSASWQETLSAVSNFYSSSVGVIFPSPRSEVLLVSIGSELFDFDGEQFNLVLQLPSEIRSIFAGPYQLWLATGSTGLYSVVMDDTAGIYWESVSKNDELSDRFGYQSIIMTDPHTLWISSSDNGLVRITALFGQ